MKVERKVLVESMLKHQHSFFRLLDHVVENSESLELPEALYLQIYSEEICLDDDERVHEYLSLESLLKNGLFIYSNKETGLVSIDSSIVAILRFLDVNRTKSLTSSDFEQMRESLDLSVQRFINASLNGEPSENALKTYNAAFSSVLTSVKDSVLSLESKVNSVAAKYERYNQGKSDVDVVDLHNEVTTLYENSVLPCYEFINPFLEMAGKRTFTQSLDCLKRHYSKYLLDENAAYQTIARKTAVTSYYKDIAVIVRRLERYSINLQQEKSAFLAIEGAYEKLMESVRKLRHGKKKNKFLTTESDFAQMSSPFSGMQQWSSMFAPKLTWETGQTELRFKHYLEEVKKEILESKPKALKPLAVAPEPEQSRKIEISKLVYTLSLPETDDLHQQLFATLKNNIANPTLIDLLYAYEAILPKTSPTLGADKIRSRINDGEYFWDYMKQPTKGLALNV